MSQKELAFVVHPQQVVFRNYDPFQKYQQVISFQNQTTVTQDVRVLPPDPGRPVVPLRNTTYARTRTQAHTHVCLRALAQRLMPTALEFQNCGSRVQVQGTAN